MTEWKKIQDRERPRRIRWKNDSERAVISVIEKPDDTFIVDAEEYIVSEPYETTVTTHSEVAPTEDEALDIATELRESISDDGEIAAIGHEIWRNYVQFYCIRNDSIPDAVPEEMTPEDLIEAIDNEEFESDIEAEEDFDPMEDADDILQIDVYPRHENEVSRTDDDEREE